MPKNPHPSWSVGLVGFFYPEWASTLYADDARARRSSGRRADHRLTTYATHFNAVEMNTTFYGIPTSENVRTWSDATPPGFRFCVKMPRNVTHGPTPPGALAAHDGPPPGHLLREETRATARRFLEAILPLGPKLGAVLMQFPPKFNATRRDELAAFLDSIARVTPHAIELRHDSWWTAETKAILQERGVSWAATDESSRREAERVPQDADKKSPRPIMPTADFLYVRWLGKHGQFTDRSKEHFDPSLRLNWWAARLHEILTPNPQIRVVYSFFDNDFAGHVPATARRFMNILGLPVRKPPTNKPDDPTLFG